MTTNVEIPYADLVADGVITEFDFTFSLVDEYDLLVMVDIGSGLVLQVPATTYTLHIIPDGDVIGGVEGGTVTFLVAPPADARVLIFRRTTISQQVDYVEGDPFPVQSHENAFDKFTYILQELIGGAWSGRDSNGDPVTLTFDLSVTANVTTVTINNSGGTDAEVPPWESGTLAGVYHGETVEEASLPAADSVTTKPDGYIWLGI